DRSGRVRRPGAAERERSGGEAPRRELGEDRQVAVAHTEAAVRRDEVHVAVLVEVRRRDRVGEVRRSWAAKRERSGCEAPGGELEEDRQVVAVAHKEAAVRGDEVLVAVPVEIRRRDRGGRIRRPGAAERERSGCEAPGEELEEDRQVENTEADVRRDEVLVAVPVEVGRRDRGGPVRRPGAAERERSGGEAPGEELEEDRQVAASNVRRDEV